MHPGRRFEYDNYSKHTFKTMIHWFTAKKIKIIKILVVSVICPQSNWTSLLRKIGMKKVSSNSELLEDLQSMALLVGWAGYVS